MRLPSLRIRQRIGARWLPDHLEEVRGDSGIVAIVKGNDGWELIPGDLVTESDEQWFYPADGSKRYPADGVPADPPYLFGTPVVIGYKEFGSLNELTGYQIAKDVIYSLEEDAESTEELIEEEIAQVVETVERSLIQDGFEDADAETICKILSTELSQSAPLDDEDILDILDLFAHDIDVTPEDEEFASVETLEQALQNQTHLIQSQTEDDSPGLRDRYRAWKFKKAWRFVQGGTDSLIFEADGDSKYSFERAEFITSDGPDWYLGEHTENYYDARGAGADPGNLNNAKFAVALAERPKLLAPVLCRYARNLHELRVVREDETTIGGETYIGKDGQIQKYEPQQQAATDGGQNIDQAVTANRKDVLVEERALVNLEDIQKLGGTNISQQDIKTAEKQVHAMNNYGGIGAKAMKFGVLILALLLGSVLVGDSDMASAGVDLIPGMIDILPAFEVILNVI